MQSWSFGSRLGTITTAQFQAALDRFNLGRFVTAAPIGGGTFGQVCYLASSEGDWVFRGNPLLPGQFSEEAYFARVLHEQTSAPVAWPYMVESSVDEFDWPYVVMPKMPGLDFDAKQRAGRTTATDDRLVALAMGRLLAETQTVTSTDWAVFDPETNGLRTVDQAFAADKATALLDTIRDRGSLQLSESDASWIDERIELGRSSLQLPAIPRLAVGDFKDQNMTFTRVECDWQVTGLFDLMGTCFQHGESAFARQFCKSLVYRRADVASLIEGYAESMPIEQGYDERLAFFVLLERLDIWEWAWRTDMVWWDRMLSFRAWAEPAVIAASEIGRAAL